MSTPAAETQIGRQELDQLVSAGQLDARQREAALQLLGLVPDVHGWQLFLSRLFLFSGAVLLVAAVGFFVAYNWDEMGRFAKIGLLELLVIVASLAAIRYANDVLRRRASLLVAVLLGGPLLAYVGQTYQTGADTYELFRAWVLLTLPWVVLARWRPLWCVSLVIANIALALFLTEAWRPLAGSSFGGATVMAHLVFNGAALVALEWAERHGAARLAGGSRSAERLALVLVVIPALVLYLHFLFESRERAAWQLLASVGTMAALWWWYHRVNLDLLALAAWVFSAIAACVATTAWLVGDLMGAHSLALLLSGATAIALSALAAGWLRRLQRQQVAKGMEATA